MNKRILFNRTQTILRSLITRLSYILRNVIIDNPNSISPKKNNTRKSSRKCKCVLIFGIAKLPNEIKIKNILIIDINLFTISYNFLHSFELNPCTTLQLKAGTSW